MKTFILKLSIAGVATLFIYLLLLFSKELFVFSDFTNYNVPLVSGLNGNQWTRLREADTTNYIDVLILGSSLAMSVDVRQFQKMKLRAFNLASGSQTPIQTSFLLNKYLDNFNPKWIIYDVHAYSFSNYGIESAVDIISNCSDCSKILPMIKQTNSMLVFNTYMKKMLVKPFGDPNFKEPLQTDFTKYITAGYTETYLKSPTDLTQMENFTYNMLEIQKHIFESELKAFKEKGIKVILIYSPKSHEYNKNFINSDEWFNYSRSLVSEGLAEDFLNFNDIIPEFETTASFFIDEAHLTFIGASVYNQALIDVLSQKEFLSN